MRFFELHRRSLLPRRWWEDVCRPCPVAIRLIGSIIIGERRLWRGPAGKRCEMLCGFSREEGLSCRQMAAILSVRARTDPRVLRRAIPVRTRTGLPRTQQWSAEKNHPDKVRNIPGRRLAPPVRPTLPNNRFATVSVTQDFPCRCVRNRQRPGNGWDREHQVSMERHNEAAKPGKARNRFPGFHHDTWTRRADPSITS